MKDFRTRGEYDRGEKQEGDDEGCKNLEEKIKGLE